MAELPPSVIRRVVVEGATFVQLEGRDPDMWWAVTSDQRYTDGESLDTSELPEERRKIKELERDRTDAIKEYDADVRSGNMSSDERRVAIALHDQEISDQTKTVRLLSRLADAQREPAFFGYGRR